MLDNESDSGDLEKSTSLRSTDEERSAWPKRRSKKSKKRRRSRSMKTKKKMHRRYSSSLSLSTHQMNILITADIKTMKVRKPQIPDFWWFLRRISTNTTSLYIWSNTPTLILILRSKR